LALAASNSSTKWAAFSPQAHDGQARGSRGCPASRSGCWERCSCQGHQARQS